MHYLLFTTGACSRCPEAKEIMKNQQLFKGEIVDCSEDGRGTTLANAYNIVTVPTVVIIDDRNGKTVRTWNGPEQIRAGLSDYEKNSY